MLFSRDALYIVFSAMLFLADGWRGRESLSNADQIRIYAREKYVLPARQRRQKRFSINAGDVVRELKLIRRVPAVCSALSTREFLRSNGLQVVGTDGPPSGQSTTVTYTYEFVDEDRSSSGHDDPWKRLRGALKDTFRELGGGEAYLKAERGAFDADTEGE